MKRARSSSVDSDASQPSSAASDSLGLARTPSSSSSLSAVEEYEEPSAVPLLSLLVPVLGLLKEAEVFGDALKRVAKAEAAGTAALEELTRLHSTAMAQHELVLMSMTREAILLKALDEARRAESALPQVWMLRWMTKPAVEHGPFTDATIQQWRKDGYFAKKEAQLRDINAVRAPWIPATQAAGAP